ncbi:MAG: sensor histidine kinase [Staphylococcus epidermidis]|nr:sensor histidine kinase [Staphylococcus epidermidis]
MLNLFILLLERVGLIILLAYILMNINHFKTMMSERDKWRSKFQLIIIFGIFSMISNFTGIEIENGHIVSGDIYYHLSKDASMANTRVLTIGVSGLIGGPWVAIIVGIISGLCRLYIGGADAYTYLISSIVIAIISGYFGHQTIKQNTYPSIKKGAIIGAITEIIQMGCILLFTNNLHHAITLVSFIALPMIIINSLGTAIFLTIILSTIKQEEQMRAVQTHDVLQLANETLPYFRSGLNEKSAQQAAEIILKLMQVSAVAITNKKDILTHIGAGSDHHVARKEIITDLSKEVIQSGKLKVAHTREGIGCHHPNCPLEGAIVVPLYIHNEVAGTLKFYFTDNNIISTSDQQLAKGLANIFSSQLELGQAEMQGQLLKDAEIKSLQAQVNPHFFFNAINTISALVRIDSEKARRLLIPNRFNIHYRIDDQCQDALIPPFIIQILVENSIKHAFKNRKKNNHIDVDVSMKQDYLSISVQDNGQGIPADQLDIIGYTTVTSTTGTGNALVNLNKRLTGLFGTTSALNIQSSQSGTTVSCLIPYKSSKEEHFNESVNR